MWGFVSNNERNRIRLDERICPGKPDSSKATNIYIVSGGGILHHLFILSMYLQQ